MIRVARVEAETAAEALRIAKPRGLRKDARVSVSLVLPGVWRVRITIPDKPKAVK